MGIKHFKSMEEAQEFVVKLVQEDKYFRILYIDRKSIHLSIVYETKEDSYVQEN